MSPRPPLINQALAVKPVVVLFDLDVLKVQCPTCRAHHRYMLAGGRPPAEPSCPSCGQLWRWT